MDSASHDGTEYEPIDENGIQPVTRAEFHDAMRDVGKSFESAESNVAGIRSDMAAKDDLIALEEQLTARMGAQAESIVKSISKHIDTTVDQAIQRNIQPLQDRVSRLEKLAGLS